MNLRFHIVSSILPALNPCHSHRNAAGSGSRRSMHLRHLWFLLTVLLLSCSSQSDDSPVPEEPEVPPVESGTPIVFSADRQEQVAATRANTPLQSTGITDFRVYAFKNMGYTPGDGTYDDVQTVMDNFAVRWVENSAATTPSNSSGWEYNLNAFPGQDIKFWDMQAVAYRFFGMAGKGITLTTINTPTLSYRLTMTVDAANEEATPLYTRLWFSDGNPEHYRTRPFKAPVVLEFVKPLAHVRYLFKYADPLGDPLPTFEEPDFRPVDVNSTMPVKGTFTVTYPITGTGTTESWTTSDFISGLVTFSRYWYTVDPSETDPDLIAGKEYWYTVVPVLNQGDYKLRAIINGEERSCIVPGQYMAWKPNYDYTYVFKINEEGGIEIESINIGTAVWKSGEEVSREINNW